MISIVKYINEMMEDDESDKILADKFRKQMAPGEFDARYKKMFPKSYVPPDAAPYQGTKVLKKTFKKTLQDPDRPRTEPGTGRKILKKGIQTMTGQE